MSKTKKKKILDIERQQAQIKTAMQRIAAEQLGKILPEAAAQRPDIDTIIPALT